MIGAVLRLAARAGCAWSRRGAGLAATATGWCLLAILVLVRLAGASMQTNDLLAATAVVLCLLLGGATLLALDALDRGFGALDDFFKEALARSSRRNAEQARAPSPSPFEDQVLRRGYIGDRPFVIHGDGTVSVDTLLGRRTFTSLTEAQDFVGA